MTKSIPIKVVCLMLLSLLTYGLMIPQAYAEAPNENFYWTNGNGSVPPGYVHCGPLGFAPDEATCVEVTAGMAIATSVILFGPASDMLKDAMEADKEKMSPAELEDAEDVFMTLEEFLKEDIAPTATDIHKEPTKFGSLLQQMSSKAAEFFESHPKLISRVGSLYKALSVGKKVVAITEQALHQQDGPIDILRASATVGSIFDESGLFSIIAAYSYPVWDPGPAGSYFANHRLDIDWNYSTYIYAVDYSGDLHYYHMDGPGNWKRSGVIGQDWGNMRFITAGSNGTLFALANDGKLYFYKVNIPQMTWAVDGQQIPGYFPKNVVIAMFAGSTWGSDQEVLYTVEHDPANNNPLYRYIVQWGSPPTLGAASQIGWGWGSGNVQIPFGGANDGNLHIIYKVTPDHVGTLDRYAFNFSTGDTPKADPVGWEFNYFKQLFAGPFGAVFAIKFNGDLLFYQDPESGRMLHGPMTIGNGWNFRLVTASK